MTDETYDVVVLGGGAGGIPAVSRNVLAGAAPGGVHGDLPREPAGGGGPAEQDDGPPAAPGRGRKLA